MGDNLRIKLFRDKLVKSIVEEPLPIELKRMIVNNILLELNQVAARQIQQEQAEFEQQSNEEKECE